MPQLLSELLGLGNVLDKKGIFDVLLDLDSSYYINIKRLKVTTVPEFIGSYEKINTFFRKIGLLLNASTTFNDKAYRAAYNMFNFPEVNEINLGVSKGTSGRGFGPELRKTILNDAKQIISAGSNEPEIFHLIGLFEDNVGPDRISDMIARIIYDNIYQYTIRINKELGINPKAYPHLQFNTDGILINPYKSHILLLLPKDILHQIPIAQDWDDIDRVYQENQLIKNDFNELISTSWSKLTVHDKKELCKNHIFMNPSLLSTVLNQYRTSSIDAYDFDFDTVGDYAIPKIVKSLASELIPTSAPTFSSSYEATLCICKKFKDITENNKGWGCCIIQMVNHEKRKSFKELSFV